VAGRAGDTLLDVLAVLAAHGRNLVAGAAARHRGTANFAATLGDAVVLTIDDAVVLVVAAAADPLRAMKSQAGLCDRIGRARLVLRASTPERRSHHQHSHEPCD
jgi:hypothetical protein